MEPLGLELSVLVKNVQNVYITHLHMNTNITGFILTALVVAHYYA